MDSCAPPGDLGRNNIVLGEFSLFNNTAGTENETEQMIISPPKTFTQTLIV